MKLRTAALLAAATAIAPCALAAAGAARPFRLDLSGEWTCAGTNFTGKARLPGTLADVGLGTLQTPAEEGWGQSPCFMPTYDLDGIGNLLQSTFNAATNAYTANCLNQYTSILCDSVTLCEPTYYTDGNMLSDGILSFTYDAASRLKTVASNGVTLVTNFYDAKSRRVKKVTPNATTTFFYDDWNLVEERIAYADNTTSTIRYYWGKDLSGTLQGAGGVGGLLWLTIDGVVYIPCYDNNGNVTRYLNVNGGTFARYSYDALGRLIARAGRRSSLFRHRFSTKYYDTETGLYYYGYRFYHPVLMRWLNRDSIEEMGGSNLYVFCLNSSSAFRDSLGMWGKTQIGEVYTYTEHGTFREAVHDFINGGPTKHYWYSYPDSATTRLLSHPTVEKAWRRFTDAHCGRSRKFSGDIHYRASVWQFFKDVLTTWGAYELDGSISRVNGRVGDYEYEVLGSFTGDYTIDVDCRRCVKTLTMRINNTFNMASATRIPGTRSSLIKRDILNPVYQTFAYDVEKPTTWDGVEIRSRK